MEIVVVEDEVMVILPEQTLAAAAAAAVLDDDDCDGYSIFVECQVPFAPFVVAVEVFVVNVVVPRKNSCSGS